jgi:hypothetical protein
MKKRILFCSLATLTIVSFFSCKKNDDVAPTPAAVVVPKPIETEITSRLFTTANGINIVSVPPGPTAEYGLGFRPSVAGKILKLGCRLPVTGSFNISVWDSAAPSTPIVTANVTISTAGTPAFTAITPLQLVANKKYVVSINFPFNPEYYLCSKSGGANIFPVSSGSINFTEARMLRPLPVNNTNPTYPTTTALNLMSGFADFEFRAD